MDVKAFTRIDLGIRNLEALFSPASVALVGVFAAGERAGRAGAQCPSQAAARGGHHGDTLAVALSFSFEVKLASSPLDTGVSSYIFHSAIVFLQSGGAAQERQQTLATGRQMLLIQ
jgi:hypothetical protein